MALTANELRIGNKVYYTVSNIGKKFIGEITKVWKSDNGMTGTIDYHYPLSFGEPIPLSPEILEKCGFEWEDWITKSYGGTEKALVKKFIVMLPTQAKTWYAAPMGYPLHPLRTLYLHQLQNLYYSLTGEELIFKP